MHLLCFCCLCTSQVSQEQQAGRAHSSSQLLSAFIGDGWSSHSSHVRGMHVAWWLARYRDISNWSWGTEMLSSEQLMQTSACLHPDFQVRSWKPSTHTIFPSCSSSTGRNRRWAVNMCFCYIVMVKCNSSQKSAVSENQSETHQTCISFLCLQNLWSCDRKEITLYSWGH